MVKKDFIWDHASVCILIESTLQLVTLILQMIQFTLREKVSTTYSSAFIEKSRQDSVDLRSP